MSGAMGIAQALLLIVVVVAALGAGPSVIALLFLGFFITLPIYWLVTWIASLRR